MRRHFGSYELDLRDRALRHGGRELPVEPKVLELLERLSDAEGTWVSSEALRARLWPRQAVGADALRRLVHGARTALASGGDARVVIQNQRRWGYRLVVPPMGGGPRTPDGSEPTDTGPDERRGGFFLVCSSRPAPIWPHPNRAPNVVFGSGTWASAWGPLLAWLQVKEREQGPSESPPVERVELGARGRLAVRLRRAAARVALDLCFEGLEHADENDVFTLESLIAETRTSALQVWVRYELAAVPKGGPASRFLARHCARDGVTELDGTDAALQRVFESL